MLALALFQTLGALGGYMLSLSKEDTLAWGLSPHTFCLPWRVKHTGLSGWWPKSSFRVDPRQTLQPVFHMSHAFLLMNCMHKTLPSWHFLSLHTAFWLLPLPSAHFWGKKEKEIPKMMCKSYSKRLFCWQCFQMTSWSTPALRRCLAWYLFACCWDVLWQELLFVAGDDMVYARCIKKY